MEKCLIRFARMEDYKSVEDIMKQVQDLHIGWRPDIYKECEVVLSYDEFCHSVKMETLVVAEVENRIVGLLSYMLRHVESNTQVTRDVLFIDSMAVDEVYRGNGIGRQLFVFIKKIAQEKKLDGIELQVNARNAQAKAMYEKCGFTEKSINMELL